MDNFREWISDNLRYILLGIAIILVIVIAFLAVRLIGGSSEKDPKKQTETESQKVAVEVQSETGTESQEESIPLVKDDAKILEVIQKFYTAVGNKDIEALKQIVEPFDENTEQQVLDSTTIESYNNISVYSKEGPVAGAYVVYSCYDGKLAGTDITAPGLSSFYLLTREDGSLYITDSDGDEEATAYRAKVVADEDVQALVKEVGDNYKAVEEANPDLADMLAAMKVPDTEVVLPDSSEVDVQVDKQVAATDVCNVRADSVETAEVLGMLNIGETVTRVRKLDNGWSEVRYGSGIGYVKSDYLTEDVSSVQNNANQ